MTLNVDIDPDDISTNPTHGPSFDEVVERRASRRSVLAGGMAGAAAFLTTNLVGSSPALARATSRVSAAELLGFTPIPVSYAGEVVVPPGYTARAFVPWGTPITGSFPAFRPGSNTAVEQEQQVGKHHDGMHYYPIGPGPSGNKRGLLVVNHEYTDESYLQTGTSTVPAKSAWTPEMVAKSQAAHGVSVIEVEEKSSGEWSVTRWRRNRRITANTPMSFSGPAAGHRLVRTSADPAGRFPFDAQSRPVKRTALGRVKHESAYVHVVKGGRVVVYTGDDQVNEHVYKFVSKDNWKSARARGRSPLDEGTLYVAKFNDDGSGEWLPLVHGQGGLTAENGFADQGDVLIKTRLAASTVGATRMDRPEWVSVDPNTDMVYLTLTNNTSSAKVMSAANPRKPNPWGHVIRWNEKGGDHTATRFEWDLFLLAGQGRSSGNGSTIADEDAFGSPDGIWSDPDGRVRIQTDGTQPLGANDQMLAANPYVTDAAGAPELRRFLTGVPGCEVTGVVTTPDQRTMFVNIQHPGDGSPSQWPHLDGLTTPRSATVVITKDDGGVIGS
jgi:secreted PhoX family phosphatase